MKDHAHVYGKDMIETIRHALQLRQLQCREYGPLKDGIYHVPVLAIKIDKMDITVEPLYLLTEQPHYEEEYLA